MSIQKQEPVYRGYHIHREPKPIPDRSHDWEFSHEDYDGAPDSGDIRCGTAASYEDCLDQIDEIERELEEREDRRPGND